MSQPTRGVSAVAVVKRRWVLLELASQPLRTRGGAAVTDIRAEHVTRGARNRPVHNSARRESKQKRTAMPCF